MEKHRKRRGGNGKVWKETRKWEGVKIQNENKMNE